MSLQWEQGRRIGTPARRLRTRKLLPYGKVSDAAATQQWFEFDIPRDSLIHSILITVGEDTTATATTRGTLADDIDNLEVIINGYLYIKRQTEAFNKALHIMNRHNALSTGFYRLDFSDPRIPESRPLPAFIDDITSIQLRIQDNAPAGSNYHHIIPTLIEEDVPEGKEAESKNFPILVETYPMQKDWGTATGWQTPYEHDRNQKVYGYVYELRDGATLEAPTASGQTFKWLRIEGRHKGGVDRIVEETYLLDILEMANNTYQSTLPTGIVPVDFPIPLNTKQYSNIYSYLNIDTAASTGARLRVLERYLLG